MSTLNRTQLLQEAITQGQLMGNLNVLLTNALAQRVGLSATEYECYSLLLEKGSMPAGQLAKLCGLTTGGTTGLIDRLEKLGLAQRGLDPNDRRRVLVIAKENKALQRKLWSLYEPFAVGIRAINNQYATDELKLVVGHFQKVNQLMEETMGKLD